MFARRISNERICRDLKVSRKVVRKVLRSGRTEFHYEREAQPFPKLGAWREELERLLTANAATPPPERLTLVRVFEALRAVGYEGGDDAIRRYSKGWHRGRMAGTPEVYVPLSFAPGEAYQFDWRRPARCARTTMEEKWRGRRIVDAVAGRLT